MASAAVEAASLDGPLRLHHQLPKIKWGGNPPNRNQPKPPHPTQQVFQVPPREVSLAWASARRSAVCLHAQLTELAVRPSIQISQPSAEKPYGVHRWR